MKNRVMVYKSDKLVSEEQDIVESALDHLLNENIHRPQNSPNRQGKTSNNQLLKKKLAQLQSKRGVLYNL